MRPAKPEDMPFVRNSWCKASYSHITSTHFLSHIGKPPHFAIYKALFSPVMDRILDDSDTYVAVDETDHDAILGYCVVGKAQNHAAHLLHYVQVKKYMWRHGVAKMLLAASGVTDKENCFYTFTSPILSKWRTPKNWQYIPHWMVS